MENIFDIKLSKKATKDLKKIPLYIAIKLQAWIDDVGVRGINEVRKVPGFHDEPLRGDRFGQRSIRLNHSYRAIYKIDKEQGIKFIEILEVNKHEY